MCLFRLLNSIDMKQTSADGLMFIITLIWGFTFIFTKLGISHTNESFFVLLRFGIALLLLLIVFNKRLFNIKKETINQGLILGFFYAGGFILQTYGLKQTTVPKSAFITGLAVPLVPFVYWFLVRKRVELFSKIGVFVASVGLWFFANPDINNLNIGDVLTLFSTVFWAFYITYMDIFTKDKVGTDYTAQLVFMQFLSLVALSLISFLIFDLDSFFIDFHPNLIYAVLYNGIIASFLLTFIHTAYQKFTTPIKAALIFSLEPVVASVASIFIFASVFTTTEIIGAIIMFSGVLTSEIGPFIFKNFTTKTRSENA